MRILFSILSGFLLTISTLLVSLWLAWKLLVPLDFGYSPGYQLLNIQQHIQIFGPQNQYKRHFGKTSEEEHQRLFHEILQAVDDKGRGLAEIVYHTDRGKAYRLLREPEIIHLKDVVQLLQWFNWAALISLLLMIGLVGFHFKQQKALPSIRHISYGLLAFIFGITMMILLVGPKDVFYWLHIKIFPDDHQWFFYYQESLMTTLMKAPDLFGYFATLWGLTALSIMALLLFGAFRLTRQPHTTTTTTRINKKRKPT